MLARWQPKANESGDYSAGDGKERSALLHLDKQPYCLFAVVLGEWEIAVFFCWKMVIHASFFYLWKINYINVRESLDKNVALRHFVTLIYFFLCFLLKLFELRLDHHCVSNVWRLCWHFSQDVFDLFAFWSCKRIYRGGWHCRFALTIYTDLLLLFIYPRLANRYPCLLLFVRQYCNADVKTIVCAATQSLLLAVPEVPVKTLTLAASSEPDMKFNVWSYAAHVCLPYKCFAKWLRLHHWNEKRMRKVVRGCF